MYKIRVNTTTGSNWSIEFDGKEEDARELIKNIAKDGLEVVQKIVKVEPTGELDEDKKPIMEDVTTYPYKYIPPTQIRDIVTNYKDAPIFKTIPFFVKRP